MHAYADADNESAVDRAFERLYRRYVKDVYRYTLALLRNPSDAEDVTQTTFLNAYRAFKRGEEPLKPHHWLIRIAHNACRSRYVRIARRPVEVPFDERVAHLPASTSDVDVREVLAALGELPFKQRAALVLRELDGRSYREIAETLDVTVPAVETLIFRARRRLRADRAALRALGAVPLPPSLVSFAEGGGAVAAGGAVLGSGIVLKVALMLAAGVVAGGVATNGFDATASPRQAARVTALREPERPTKLASAPARLAAAAATLRKSATARSIRRIEQRASTGGLATRGRGAKLAPGARHAGTIGTADPAPPATSSGGSIVTQPAPVARPAASPPPESRPSRAPSPPSPAFSPPVAAPAAALPAVPTPPALPDPVASVVPPPPPLPKLP